MLSAGGILCMIISDRYLNNKNVSTPKFAIFLQYMERILKIDPTAYHYTKTGDFQTTNSNFSKLMKTSFPMICIYLKKIEYFEIHLDKPLEKLVKVSKPRILPNGATEKEKENYEKKLKLYNESLLENEEEEKIYNDQVEKDEKNDEIEEVDESKNSKSKGIKKVKHNLNKDISMKTFYDVPSTKKDKTNAIIKKIHEDRSNMLSKLKLIDFDEIKKKKAIKLQPKPEPPKHIPYIIPQRRR